MLVLKQELASIAQAEDMKFMDGSEQTKKDLEAIKAPEEARRDPVINMGVEGADGIGLTAGSLGMPSYQVVIGFSEGSNQPKAHSFADNVVKKLNTRWHVKTVPAGTGAFPLKTCD